MRPGGSNAERRPQTNHNVYGSFLRSDTATHPQPVRIAPAAVVERLVLCCPDRDARSQANDLAISGRARRTTSDRMWARSALQARTSQYNPADATFFVWVVLLATAGLCYPDVAKFRSPDARAKHVEYWTAKA